MTNDSTIIVCVFNDNDNNSKKRNIALQREKCIDFIELYGRRHPSTRRQIEILKNMQRR